jgi:hypothetical protein
MQIAYIDFISYCRDRQEDTLMNTHSLNIGTDAQSPIEETETLAQCGFTQEEIASLLRLREWYQHGGSDRMEVVRHLAFLKFLVTHGKLPS